MVGDMKPSLIAAVLLILTLITASTLGYTQDAPQPKARVESHRLFDRANVILLATSAAALSMDAYVTRSGLTTPGCTCREGNPIARPFVKSNAGAALYFGASFAIEIATMKLAHHYGWHKVERTIPIILGATEVKAIGSWY